MLFKVTLLLCGLDGVRDSRVGVLLQECRDRDACPGKRVVCGFSGCFLDNHAGGGVRASYPEKVGCGMPSHGIGRA